MIEPAPAGILISDMNGRVLRRLIIGAVVLIAVVAGIVVFLVVDEGDVGISAVLSYISSPVIISILAEFMVIAFLVTSFIISKERRGLRCASLGFAAGLVAFYFAIPRIPVDMAPNHPDEGWDSGEVVHLLRSGGLDLSTRPVATLHPGTLSVDKGGYPSKGIRGIKAQPPTALEVREELPSFEKAGFVIMDVDREKITARFYAWRNGTDPVEAIDTLEPHYVFEVPARR